MSYNQEKNPLSRKTSPLNENNPFKRISPLSMAEEGIKHKDMSKDDKKKHKKAKHSKGGDPDMERERREEEMSRSSNEPLGPERKSSDPNTKLSAYKNVNPEDTPGYDDGAGGFDYEAMERHNSAPGAQYTDEAAEEAFKKMKYTTDAAIRSGAGVDLGTIYNKNGMSRHKSGHDNIDPDLVKEAETDFKVRPPRTQGDSIQLTHTMRKVGEDPQSETDSRFRFYEKAGEKGGLLSRDERIAAMKLKRNKEKQ
jgi:hypothetical protein